MSKKKIEKPKKKALKIELEDNIEISNGYFELMGTETFINFRRREFPIPISFKLNVIVAEMISLREIYGKEKEKIILEFAKRDENGEPIKEGDGTSIGDMKGFTNAMSILNRVKVSLTKKRLQISSKEFGKTYPGRRMSELEAAIVVPLMNVI